jgi:hypothetical protein
VRGFTRAYHETYVRTGKGLPVLTSELAEDCQFCWWECKKNRTIPLFVHTTVRGFTGAYLETYVRTGKGLPVLMKGDE